MKLKVLGSNSSGNCYILESDIEALIIEAGLPFREVKKELNFNVRKIVGVICTHGHKDHSGYVGEYEEAGIPVFKPYDETIACPLNIKYGKFLIQAFRLVHDVPCYGFYISEQSMGSLIYASDTEYIKYRFRGLNHILVEANYSEELIDSEAINREHILRGHMSLRTAIDFIFTNDNPALRNVVLIHLSDKNADSVNFQLHTEEILKSSANVYVAEKGLEVDLNLFPF